MAVRDWSTRRLRRFWLHGLVAEVIVIAIGVVVGRASRSPEPPSLRHMRAVADSQERGLLPPSEPLTSSQRAEFRRLLNDSLGLNIVRRGDTVRVVPVSARGDSVVRSVGRFTTRLHMALDHAVRAAILTLAAILLPIPATVLAVTLYWFWIRWRRRSVPSSA